MVQHAADGGIGHFEGWLAEHGVEVVVARPYLGEGTLDTAGFDGVIVLGGAMGALDDDAAPWLPDVRKMMAGAAESGPPLLGVCLGAQLLAAACDGRVARAADVPGADAEIGVVEVRLDAGDDPLLGALPATLPATQWHVDMVAEPPPGAVPLARSAACPYQAFRVGGHAWGLQFHPEVTRTAFDTWNRSGRDALTSRGLTPDGLLAGYDARTAELHTAARTIAHAFATIVTTAAPR